MCTVEFPNELTEIKVSCVMQIKPMANQIIFHKYLNFS